MPTAPKGQKRPADGIGNAIMVAKIATGEIEEGTEPDDSKDKAAQAVGRKGGAAWRAPSVFLGQHDGQHPGRDGWIGGIGRVAGQAPVVVIDFEQDALALDLQGAEVVLLIGVVLGVKVV